MQTDLQPDFLKTTQGEEANSILRSCVHCGFCTATCPTYQLLGDELDSPRGRIYLIKQVLEGKPTSEKTRLHLDRCLTCRSCETTCPSGVRYGRLIDIGREVVEKQVPRLPTEYLQRFLLRKIIPNPHIFKMLLTIANLTRPLLTKALKSKTPELDKSEKWPQQSHLRKMLILEGCAQKVVHQQTNVAAAKILGRLGVELVRVNESGCCGAVSHHLSAINESHDYIKRNIDAWWSHIENGAEAIVVTASGCGVMVKDYGHIMQEDIYYAEKAARVSELAKDLSEILINENIISSKTLPVSRIAFHSPCTLQHGQKLNGVVEQILKDMGYQLVPVKDPHLCCGSAGTYSILQSELSTQLRQQKLSTLEEAEPELIATANIGCQMHLASGTKTPVRHWIELVDEAM